MRKTRVKRGRPPVVLGFVSGCDGALPLGELIEELAVLV